MDGGVNPNPTLLAESGGKPAGMAVKIGVMGGAANALPPEHLAKAGLLGEAIAQQGCILITGGCPGLPLAAAGGAKRRGGLVVGISPGLSLDEHIFKYESPTLNHDVLLFTGSGLMGREVVNIRSSDIVVIIGGSSGTLGELAIAYDEGKLIGVLTGTGGISDLVPSILAACQKQTGARVIYDDEPARLVGELLTVYRTEHYRRPSCFCRTCDAADISGNPGSERDVVCGMWIDPSAAVAKRTVEGNRYLFCSLQCADSFDHAPHKYLTRSLDHERR
jgi:uncharacterized protein (TIGR00725 family)